MQPAPRSIILRWVLAAAGLAAASSVSAAQSYSYHLACGQPNLEPVAAAPAETRPAYVELGKNSALADQLVAHMDRASIAGTSRFVKRI